MNPTLSIITGTLNRHEEFRRLLRSIINNTAVPWELIVSDASDVPVDVPCLPNVTVIREVPRLGCTRGYNAAFRQARGTWVLWLNDDCEVLPGYADAAISFMEAHPAIGLGALYYKEGAGDFHVSAYFSMEYANFGILRREFLGQIGFFDDAFVMYGADNALSLSVLLSGKGVTGIPDARIIHYATPDSHRSEHNDYERRCHDADLLATKFGPFMEEIKATYARLGCESNGLNDQTPAWLEDKIKA